MYSAIEQILNNNLNVYQIKEIDEYIKSVFDRMPLNHDEIKVLGKIDFNEQVLPVLFKKFEFTKVSVAASKRVLEIFKDAKKKEDFLNTAQTNLQELFFLYRYLIVNAIYDSQGRQRHIDAAKALYAAGEEYLKSFEVKVAAGNKIVKKIKPMPKQMVQPKALPVITSKVQKIDNGAKIIYSPGCYSKSDCMVQRSLGQD